MKKIFTLCMVVMAALSMNAQKETYVPWEGESHALKAEWKANEDVTKASEVAFSTTNVSGVGVSGPISGYTDAETLPLVAKYDNSWGTGNNCGDGNVYCVNGKGNPTSGVAFVEVRTEGAGTGKYRACYDTSNDPEGPFYAEDGKTTIDKPNFYYLPDGSTGLPKNGVYFTFTPKVDGKMTVIGWVNKNNRKTFIVKKSDMKALTPGTEVIYQGYINNNNAPYTVDGKKVFQESLELNTTSPYIPQPDAVYNCAAWIYFSFEAKANETYYVFCQTAQFGFGGYEFTPAKTEEVKITENIPANTTKTVGSTNITTGTDGTVTANGDGSMTLSGNVTIAPEAAGNTVKKVVIDLSSAPSAKGMNVTADKQTIEGTDWYKLGEQLIWENAAGASKVEIPTSAQLISVGINSLVAKTISVTTQSGTTGIHGVYANNVDAGSSVAPRKHIENGRILIGNYNLAGQRVK